MIIKLRRKIICFAKIFPKKTMRKILNSNSDFNDLSAISELTSENKNKGNITLLHASESL